MNILGVKSRINKFLIEEGYELTEFKKKQVKIGAPDKYGSVRGKKENAYIAKIGKKHFISIRRHGQGYIVDIYPKKGINAKGNVFIFLHMRFDDLDKAVMISSLRDSGIKRTK